MIPIPSFMKRGIMRYIGACIGITITLIQVAQFAVYFGDLGGRATLGLFSNSSSLLQGLNIDGANFGWIFSYLIAAMIMIGPMDYYVTLDGGNAIDLVLMLLGGVIKECGEMH